MAIENNIALPINDFGMGMHENPFLANQDFYHDMFKGFNQGWEIDNLSDIMTPSTSGTGAPISVIGRPAYSVVEQVAQTNDSDNNVEVENEDFHSYSEFEEMRQNERKKVIIIFKTIIYSVEYLIFKYFYFLFIGLYVYSRK